jgi:dethiobiotin synthetase
VRGLFVTGTGTGVGKTILSAALLAAMRSAGESVRAHKPVVTGIEEQSEGWPPDHELLALAAGLSPEEVAPFRYAQPVSPHLASTLAGDRITPADLLANARAAAGEHRTLIVEGVGGLLVPLTDSYTVRDLAVDLGLPVVIAAQPGLGTINHTLLTLHGARAAGLIVRAVVLTPWPEHPTAIEHSNRETVSRLGAVDVHGLRALGGPDVGALRAAGEQLPWRSWL